MTVEAWGRCYAFSGLPFPKGVVSTESDILAGPVRLVTVVEGREQSWSGRRLEIAQQSEARVTLRSAAEAADLELEAQVSVEYDGMVRVDWQAIPRRSLRLDRLVLEIPFKPEHAGYLYFFPGRWASTYNAMALPPEGKAMPFQPLVWLGSEDRGLAWFCESDHNWLSDESDAVTEIERRDDRVILRLNIVKRPVELVPGAPKLDRQRALTPTEPVGELAYTFGFQATPVKQPDKDAWDYRLTHNGDYGIESIPADFATLTYSAWGNVTLDRGSLELWLQPVFGFTYDYGQRRPIVSLDLPGEAGLAWFWNQNDRKVHFQVREQGRVVADLSGPADWRPGQWHHLATTWGEALRLYVDGDLVSETKRRGTVEAPLANALLVFGGSLCGFTLDEIRTSWIARSPEEIEAAAGGAFPYDSEDVHVLLLDHLDNTYDPGNIEHLDSYGTFTRPAIFGRRFGGQAGRDAVRYVNGYTGMGLVDGAGRFVPGKFGQGLQLGGWQEPVLDRLAREGVRGVCFHEHWTDWQSYPCTDKYAAEMRSLVQGCHERDIQLLLYYGFDFSALAPEFEAYHEECLVKPHHGGRTYTCTPAPLQRTFTVCYQSVWQDAIVAGIAHMMDEYDVDGVYLDGTEYPHACANLAHGCGYVREDGSVAQTYPIFATREIMRRIYTVVKSRKPDGQVNVHNSTCMTIPTIAWATSLWDGEQFGHIEPGPHALTVLPLDAFRTEFMGHQWGVPGEFLCYERPFTYQQSLSVTLLHDVPVRPIGAGPNLDVAGKLWRTMDAFGRKEAEWLPYWRNQGFVQVSPEGALASLYRHPENGVLMVLSNLGRRSAPVTARLNLEQLGLGVGAIATDAMSGEVLPLREGALRVDLPSMGWVLAWLKQR
ncbi:MAG: LamG domain-containing protein [Anaerolineae bacterium]|nr:LamG domain-containing protein [Anaerolineae bacterium]